MDQCQIIEYVCIWPDGHRRAVSRVVRSCNVYVMRFVCVSKVNMVFGTQHVIFQIFRPA